jgi:hypothetical protein
MNSGCKRSTIGNKRKHEIKDTSEASEGILKAASIHNGNKSQDKFKRFEKPRKS